MIVNLQVGKVFKGKPKKCDIVKTLMLMLLVIQRYIFFQYNLDIINPCSGTCPSTMKSLQKVDYEVNNDINSKVSLCQGDIIKLNVDTVVNSANKILTGRGGIDGSNHEAAGPGLLHEC